MLAVPRVSVHICSFCVSDLLFLNQLIFQVLCKFCKFLHVSTIRNSYFGILKIPSS